MFIAIIVGLVNYAIEAAESQENSVMHFDLYSPNLHYQIKLFAQVESLALLFPVYHLKLNSFLLIQVSWLRATGSQ